MPHGCRLPSTCNPWVLQPPRPLFLTGSRQAEAPLPSGQARAGQVATITLVNFMCHEHLTMDFGPNVTFISGSNGSGKSAALTALQCCLGARARDTGRCGGCGCGHRLAMHARCGLACCGVGCPALWWRVPGLKPGGVLRLPQRSEG